MSSSDRQFYRGQWRPAEEAGELRGEERTEEDNDWSDGELAEAAMDAEDRYIEYMIGRDD